MPTSPPRSPSASVSSDELGSRLVLACGGGPSAGAVLETAARIAEAVQRLATTKEGPLRRVMIIGVAETRLLVPPYAAIVSIDRRARLLRVWRIVRYAPR